MLSGQISTLLIVAFTLIIGYLILKYKKRNINSLTYKITSLVLGLVFLLCYMWDYNALKYIVDLNNSPIDSEFFTVLSILLNWVLIASVLLVILNPFFKNEKCETLIKTFGFISSILCAIFLPILTQGIVGKNAYNGFNFRSLLMGLEVGILVAYCFVVFMENGKFKIKKKNIIAFAYIPAILLFTMLPYVPNAFGIIGNPEWETDELGLWHRIFLYFSLIVPLIIYFVLRKKDMKTKKLVLLYLSLSALIIFWSYYPFPNWKNPSSLPLHLCHTALYILVLCLIFKMKRLFYFTYFINVLGAFFAMVMPDLSGNIFAQGTLHFWNNHYFAFFMPLLIIALEVYDRPKLKEWGYSVVGFTIYFVFIVFINAWFTNYDPDIDYFYVNSDFIADKLGLWAENLRDVIWTFNIGNLKFVLYPLYQFLFWLVYIAMSVGVWFLYEVAYTYTDTINDMVKRRDKIKIEELALKSQLNGRTKEEPLYMENTNKMILHNFTKIYGKSNVYAVKDANLEVHGGEIFGFLGPNGAGKSTIIKSIVGIQPITDGSIEVCGYDVDKQSVMAKQQIGFVPDHYALYEKLTGREYINYIADLYKVSKEDRDQRINHYVEIFELQTAFDNQMKTYSHGMKQKIAIMAALVHNPKVWILDEPLTGLDPNSIFQVKECMKQHAKDGNIVFFSSHIIDVVERICDKIGIIKKGQIQCVKTIEEIESSGSTLEDFYMHTINDRETKAIPVKSEKTQKDSKNKKSKAKKDTKKQSWFDKLFKKKSESVELNTEIVSKEKSTTMVETKPEVAIEEKSDVKVETPVAKINETKSETLDEKPKQKKSTTKKVTSQKEQTKKVAPKTTKKSKGEN